MARSGSRTYDTISIDSGGRSSPDVWAASSPFARPGTAKVGREKRGARGEEAEGGGAGRQGPPGPPQRGRLTAHPNRDTTPDAATSAPPTKRLRRPTRSSRTGRL